MRADFTLQRFADRNDAGQQLADLLALDPPPVDAVVLALPRGGVPIGVAVAQRFALPLEPLLVRKLGVPHNPEFAMGALATGGVCLLDHAVVQALHLPEQAVKQVIATEQQVLADRERRYGASVPLAQLTGRPVVLCDDGMATGSSVQAALAALRAVKVGAITVAVPVLSREALTRIQPLVQRVVYLLCPESFDAVGQWYRSFPQLGDLEVISLLTQVRRVVHASRRCNQLSSPST